MFATLIGIVALMALLLTVVNDAFGYIAIQNKIDPEILVLNYHKDRMLAMPSTRASEDDAELVAGIAPRDQAIGFFGYGVYQQATDDLKLVSVEGQLPDAESVASGEYPLARPLFVYSSDVIMREKPQVTAFLFSYLNSAETEVQAVGYFPIDAETTAANLEEWSRASRLTETTAAGLESPPGDVIVTGSSTVAPITQRMADLAIAGGFPGAITIESIGTDAGFRRFCLEGTADIADASRAMSTLDISACQARSRNPVQFHIGNDGLSVVTSAKNDFVDRSYTGAVATGLHRGDHLERSEPGLAREKDLPLHPGARIAARSTSLWKRCSAPISPLSRRRR